MPFTASHAAAVLPFVGRGGLVPAALVIGSMTPDLPYFLLLGSDSTLTHSALGLITVDLAMGLAAFAIWQGLLARSAWSAAPAAVRARISSPAALREFSAAASLAMVVLSLLLGSATHVLWDAFTHVDRWGTQLVPWLHTEHGGVPGYGWAQYASSLGGLLIVGAYLVAWWRQTPASVMPEQETAPAAHRAVAVWIAAAGATMAFAALGLVDALAADDGWRRGVYRASTWGGAAGLITVIAGSLLLRWPRPRAR